MVQASGAETSVRAGGRTELKSVETASLRLSGCCELTTHRQASAFLRDLTGGHLPKRPLQ